MGTYPGAKNILHWFYIESGERHQLPNNTPDIIKSEFQEAESCLEAKCYRAAAAMFRSTLEKVFEANGYKTDELKSLYARINKASEEGIITEARKLRAHNEVRVLGNDVLHEPWKKFVEDDVVLAHKYTQRIIEDFYDMRDTVELRLRVLNRIEEVEEIQAPEESNSVENNSEIEGVDSNPS